MTDLIQTNLDVLQNPTEAKDNFFLTGHYSAAGQLITISPNGHVVSQKEEHATGTAIFRKTWDNSETRSQLDGIDQKQRMIGAGGIVSVQTGTQSCLTILFKKTGNGPSKGRMAQATGLADSNPIETMINEIAEETGVILVDRENQKLTFLCITPNENLAPVFNRTSLIEKLMKEKEAQINIIRKQLDGDIAEWPITVKHRNVDLNPEMAAFMEEITIQMPDGEAKTISAIIADSDKTANINIMLPVLLQLPEGTEYIALDPEKYERPVEQFTLGEMVTQDFIDQKSSVPMRGFLQKVQRSL